MMRHCEYCDAANAEIDRLIAENKRLLALIADAKARFDDIAASAQPEPGSSDE